MKSFASLLDALVYMPSRNGKLRLIGDYLNRTADPHRGWALAAIAGGLDLRSAKPAMVRSLLTERVDPVLFALSYDYVGDLAETCALLWPSRRDGAVPTLDEIVTALQSTSRAGIPQLLADWLDLLDGSGRWALLKLVTGGLRVGVSARLAKTALAETFGRDTAAIEEIWHDLEPPYGTLFAWLEGHGKRPRPQGLAGFCPFMLAHPMEDNQRLDPSEFLAEWKWDGTRVQLVARSSGVRLFSRSGDDISAAFPDVLEGFGSEAVLDGELMVRAPDGSDAPFQDLQKRLNRKTVTRSLMQRSPAFIRAYDLLFDGSEDLRSLPLWKRRMRLEAFYARVPSPRLDLSTVLSVADWDSLARLRDRARDLGMEGLMLKRRDSRYTAGRTKGQWYKWKRDPLGADVVLMYAQRGHGKRSSLYSDFTFGVWRDGELLPVGKAYFGFTNEELSQLDSWVRRHTIGRFGPVREVEKSLVLEVAFDAVQPSGRHKSGLAMRFPRIKRIRRDKPAAEADTLDRLNALVTRNGKPSA